MQGNYIKKMADNQVGVKKNGSSENLQKAEAYTGEIISEFGPGESVPEVDSETYIGRYAEKKKASFYLSLIERKLRKPEKAERLEICGTSLVFERMENGRSRLVFGNFCRVRLCPMCQWRRSAKLQSQMFMITDKLSEQYAFIFLTLTVPNCDADELRSTLASMQAAWNRFRQLKQIKKVVRGYYRGIEITHDIEPVITEQRYKKMRSYYQKRGIRAGEPNPNYGKYHPHYHIVIAVNKSYFTSRDYLPQAAWRELWEQSYRASGKLQVDIRSVKPRRAGEEASRKAVLEVTKYPVKDSEYLSGDLTEDTRTVEALERELRDLRFVSLGGCFKEMHAQLHLGDFDEPDADSKSYNEERLAAYIWRTGVTAFEPSESYVKQFLAYEAARKEMS